MLHGYHTPHATRLLRCQSSLLAAIVVVSSIVVARGGCRRPNSYAKPCGRCRTHDCHGEPLQMHQFVRRSSNSGKRPLLILRLSSRPSAYPETWQMTAAKGQRAWHRTWVSEIIEEWTSSRRARQQGREMRVCGASPQRMELQGAAKGAQRARQGKLVPGKQPVAYAHTCHESSSKRCGSTARWWWLSDELVGD